MELKTNVWDVTKSVVAIALVIFVWFHGTALINSFRSDNSIPEEIKIQLQQNQVLIQNLRASNSEFKALVSKLIDQNGQQADLIDKVNKENAKKGARLEEIGVTIANLERSVNRLSNSSATTNAAPKTGDSEEDKRRDKLTNYFTKIYSKDADGKEFPIAWAMYFPNEDNPAKKWRTGTYDLEFHETIIESENKDGTFSRAVEVHVENNKQKETKGQEFPIKLSSVEWEKTEVRDKSMSWWNPRLGLGCTSSSEDIAPKIDLSVASYGKTRVDMDWRFLTFGVGLVKSESTELIGSFEPFSWNAGKALPLVENIFIGPVVTMGSKANTGYGVSLSIPF